MSLKLWPFKSRLGTIVIFDGPCREERLLKMIVENCFMLSVGLCSGYHVTQVGDPFKVCIRNIWEHLFVIEELFSV